MGIPVRPAKQEHQERWRHKVGIGESEKQSLRYSKGGGNDQGKSAQVVHLQGQGVTAELSIEFRSEGSAENS